MKTYTALYELDTAMIGRLEEMEQDCGITVYYNEYSNAPFPCFHLIMDENNNILSYLGIYVTNDNNAELSGMTDKRHRKCGYFYHLIINAFRLLNANGINCIVSEFTPELSYIRYGYLYSEYMLKKEYCNMDIPIPLTFSIKEFDYSDNENIDMDYVGYFMDIPVGIMSVSGSIDFACIHNVKIRKAYRGNYYGTYLVSSAICNFFKKYKCSLYLHVSGKNTAALKLYRNCEFTVHEEIHYFKISIIA